MIMNNEHINALIEGAERETTMSQGEQTLIWEDELNRELSGEDRQAYEGWLESLDREDEILAEQEALYARELLTTGVTFNDFMGVTS
jgi:hypothetical protein